MRKVIVSEFVTLDGVMEAPDKWQFPFWNDETGKLKVDELFASDALLLGRVTYQEFAKAWPSITDEEGFADRMNSLPKFVASTTLKEPRVECHPDQGQYRAGSLQAKAAARPRHPHLRRRWSCPFADETGPHRRISAVGLPDCSGEWQASLYRRGQCDPETCRNKADGCRCCFADLPDHSQDRRISWVS